MTSSNHRRKTNAENKKTPDPSDPRPATPGAGPTPGPTPAPAEGLTSPSPSAADQAAEDMLEALLALDDAEEEIDEISSALEDLLAPHEPSEAAAEDPQADIQADIQALVGSPPETAADTRSKATDEILADIPADTPDDARPGARPETQPETQPETRPDRPADRQKDTAKGRPADTPENGPAAEQADVPTGAAAAEQARPKETPHPDRHPEQRPAPPPALRAEPAPPVRRKKKSKLPDKPAPNAPSRARDDLDRVLRVEARTGASRGSWLRRLFWLTILGLLIFGLTRPYAMEVGGEFIIQPLDRAEVRARTDGEIVQVNVEEGDRVAEGAVLAVLSNWDEKRDVAVRRAEIARLEAQLETLIEGPKPSEIAVAEQRVATAQIQLEIAATALERQEQLLEAGVISESRVEDARANHRLAAAKVAEQESSLALVSEQATPQEIASAQAEIARNLEDLKFAELKLEQTYIRATVSGQVVSTMTEVPIGTYLPEGGLFAELEDNRTVVAMIEVPETSIEDVRVDARVEMRLWSDTGTSVYGTVKRLAPRAEEREFGRVVRVNVEVPNPDGKLNGNMTGQAKIDAGVFPAWVVFTRLIVRFFDVEVWSWLP